MTGEGKRLTTQDIEAIRKRAEAATEGPWKNVHGIVLPENGDKDFNRKSNADADFIANAREDIPALLAEVDRLRAELAGDGLLTLRDQVDPAREYIAGLVPKYDDMTSIALWATRRLAHQQHKDFAYDAIDANTGEEVERV